MSAGERHDGETTGGRPSRPRGRRPAGKDTRAVLLDAARAEFIERGYDSAPIRVIAKRAGVDPAMISHWFGGKEGLFAAAMELPVNPAVVLRGALAGDPDRTAERILRSFLSIWDGNGGGALTGLMRSVSSNEDAARMLQEIIGRAILDELVMPLAPDRPELRATLCATQIAGLGMVRYVLRLEPLASAEHDTVVAAVAPNLQHYLTGALG